MMDQMNRSATARKFEDPDGFRRTPVSAPLPRRGIDAGRHIAGYTMMIDWSSRDLQFAEVEVRLGPVKAQCDSVWLWTG